MISLSQIQQSLANKSNSTNLAHVVQYIYCLQSMIKYQGEKRGQGKTSNRLKKLNYLHSKSVDSIVPR